MFTKQDNEVLDKIIEARKTCRSFSEEVPSKNEIEAIIKAGELSPYASIDSKSVKPFRHFYVIYKDDPRMDIIDKCIKEQSALDLEIRLAEKEMDDFLMENGAGVEKLWANVAKNGESTFPNPPCVIIAAEWRGARRAERQSLAHMMENMWLKATALNLDFQIISVTENMIDNEEFCNMLGLPLERYGFLMCVVGHAKESIQHDRPSCEIHW